MADFHKFQLCALISWDLVWWSRNQIVHHAASLDVLSLLLRLRRSFEGHVAAWSRRCEAVEIARWNPPTAGLIKVNFDVAIRTGFAVGAAVLSNHLGRVVGLIKCRKHLWLDRWKGKFLLLC